ncbi:ornithine cyclodeaminase family protein [Corynebacterium sp. CCM 9203]|uniref:ornithine cyclodeaminase family protein n=1 Tax=Corynebacterium sp. CCM 9203 TaxID=3057615 RepID=UPI0035235BF3
MESPNTTWFDNQQLRASVDMRTLIAEVRDALVGLHKGDFEIPLRLAPGDGRFLVMPVRHIGSETLAVKSLSANFTGRRPALSGTLTWEEWHTERHVGVDAAEATAMRTGAISGVATDLLAFPGARNLTVIGAGGQAPDQIRAVLAVRDITSVTVTSLKRDSALACINRVEKEFHGVRFTATTDPRDAVAEADIICCATPSTAPLFSLDDLKPGSHVNLIGSYRPEMREMSGDDVAQASLFVDDIQAVTTEAGEVIEALESGVLDRCELRTLGSALTEGNVAHEPEQVSIFKSVGVAVQDWALMRTLVDTMDTGARN